MQIKDFTKNLFCFILFLGGGVLVFSNDKNKLKLKHNSLPEKKIKFFKKSFI